MSVGDIIISFPFLLLLLFGFIAFIVNRRIWTGIEAFCSNTLYVSATRALEMHMWEHGTFRSLFAPVGV